MVTSSLCDGGTTVTGTCVTGATVIVYNNGASPVTASVSGTGWTATLSPYTTGDVITATAQIGGQCLSATSTTVTVNALPAPTVNSPTICSGNTATLNASGGTSYSWSTGATTNSITTTFAGTYTVTATNSAGCTAAANGNVTVNALPRPTVNSPSICVGATATLTATGGASYTWSTGATTNPITTTTAGTYTVTATNAAGCTAAASGTVTVNPLPTPTVNSPALCTGGTATLTATGGTSYSWSTGATTNPITTTTAGTFTVTATNAAGCTATASGVVTLYSSTLNATLSNVGDNGTTLTELCAENNWTYFIDPSDPSRWLFAIKKYTTSTTNIFTATVKLTVNPTGNLTSLNTTSTHKNGSYLLSRYWNVNISGTINNPVDVKFYYDQTDSVNAVNAMTADANTYSCPAANRSSWRWFKSVGSDFNPSNISGNGFNFSNITLTPASYGTENGVSYVQFNGIQSFSGGTGGVGFNTGFNGVSLPVQLVSFTAEPFNNEFIRTQWSTASEINNKGFEIERSTDGITFESIGWVDGAYNSNTVKNYSFDDLGAVSNTIYYYRLKQIDIDGKYTYSNIASATLMGPKGFALEGIRPNPATDKLSIYVVSQSNIKSTITATDMLGREILNKDWELSSGYNGTELDVSSFASGTYIFTISSENIITSKRIIITR